MALEQRLAQDALDCQVFLVSVTSHILLSSTFLATGSLPATSVTYKQLPTKHSNSGIAHMSNPQITTCKPFRMKSYPNPFPLSGCDHLCVQRI